MREREPTPEVVYPEGIKILRQFWVPSDLERLTATLPQLRAVERQYRPGFVLSEEDREIVKVVTELTHSAQDEWRALLQHHFPEQTMFADYIERPKPHRQKSGNPVQPWHSESQDTITNFTDLTAVFWSNREPTEIRDATTKQLVVVPSGSIVAINNGRYEHRRPPGISPDRYLAHAFVFPAPNS